MFSGLRGSYSFMFKQSQYVPLTATRKCPLDWIAIWCIFEGSKRSLNV